MTPPPPVLVPTTDRRSMPIGVIGAGRLGTALTGALAAAGYADVRLASRSEARAREVATTLDVVSLPVERIVDECALVFLAVPDRAIATLVGELAWRPGVGVVHHSGALGLEVLAAVIARGALAGCLHPLQTFPGASTTADCAALFRDITCGIEAPAPLHDLINALAGDLGARTVSLEGVDRARYHAAAVLVSNDVVALMAAARRVWAAAGLPEDAAREALAPLLLAAGSNVARLPLEQALTGPVARGDADTVRRHLEALGGAPDLSDIYRALGRELLRLDLGHAPEVSATLRSLLDR